MRSRHTSCGFFAALALVFSLVLPAAAQERSPAHLHIRHASETFRGTPDGMGLLPTAIAEGEIARQHAGLAARTPTDLDAMKRHAAHVGHVLDPGSAEGGPGLGYGLVKAAERTAHYVELAQAADGGGDALDTHGTHVATAARNAESNARSALAMVRTIQEAEEAAQAAEAVEELVALVEAILEGVDANGDGRIGWGDGEGGLAQASTHMDLLRRGEGMGG